MVFTTHYDAIRPEVLRKPNNVWGAHVEKNLFDEYSSINTIYNRNLGF